MGRARRFGAHIGLQDTTADDVVSLAVHAERAGFDWVSSWDHFYSSGPRDGGSLEGVAMQAVIAAATTRVRVGSLVYNVAYRNPGVIAHAIATIDQISHGRAELGLGGGWSQREHDAYGIPFRAPGPRLDALDEGARCVRMLLRQDVSSFSGRYFTLVDARCDPRPVQPELPIWIGGRGEKRTLRIVAELADGWNGAFLSLAEFTHKRALLREYCEEIGRDPETLAYSVNLGIGLTPGLLDHHFATMGDSARASIGGVVTGHGGELVDQIGAYCDAGADQVNFTWRAPFDLDAVDLIAEAVAQLRT